jgi:hypothetical protein
LQKHVLRLALRIVAALGFVPLSKTGAEKRCEVFGQRYERGLTLGTSKTWAARRVEQENRPTGLGLRFGAGLPSALKARPPASRSSVSARPKTQINQPHTTAPSDNLLLRRLVSCHSALDTR